MSAPDADWTGSDAFRRPYLQAMARLQRRETLSLDQLSVQAERLLLDTFGPADAQVVTRSGRGTVALLGHHTYYFDGFALMLPLPFGAVVALRPVPAADAAIVFDAPRRVISLPVADGAAGEASSVDGVLPGILEACLAPHGAFQAAVVSTVPRGCADGYMAALAVSAVQAARAAGGRASDDAEVVREATAAVAGRIDRPYGVAPTLGACFAEEGRALAIDTATLEYVALDLPARERLAWALVDTGPRAEPQPRIYARRRAAVEEATERLREGLLTQGRTLRSLEHRQLDGALRQLPRRLRPLIRHLVTENRRVQQVIGAIRRADCQLLGGMLLISQASIEKDWQDCEERIRRAIALGEEREGLYGGRMVGREFGSFVLMLGQPVAVARYVEDLRQAEPPDRVDGDRTWVF